MKLNEFSNDKQLDEVLPAVGAALGAGAKAVGGALAKGAQAVGGAVKAGAQAVGQAAVGVGHCLAHDDFWPALQTARPAQSLGAHCQPSGARQSVDHPPG